jgi:2-dehydro-3-deoxygalactonokinase
VNPELIALDWGTSSLRAFLIARGEVLVQRHSHHGIQHLPQPGRAGFEQAFREIASDWLQDQADLPVFACGMVGSAQGWCEAPYVRCPADMKSLVNQSVYVDSGRGTKILIAPGVLFDHPDELPDVMRGEETQIAGALLMNSNWSAESCMVLPGTHSKWVKIKNGSITRYKTFMTGELFDVLCKHSILGRLMPSENDSADIDLEANFRAFKLGVTTAQRITPGALSHEIFATRTLGLTGHLPHTSLSEYLSGLLIGHELISGLAGAGDLQDVPLLMIGDSALCARYQNALTIIGSLEAIFLENSAPAGLWMLAKTAGLVSNSGTQP